MTKLYSYFKLFKPYGMLSQFSREGDHETLADINFNFPKDVYPVGRLDLDSEGLLILTNDPRLNKSLLHPESKKVKTYQVQIEGIPREDSLNHLRSGVVINLKSKLHRTHPASVKMIDVPEIPERIPMVNYSKHPVTSWLEIKITEGKNRQIRKMTAKIGHPTLRLIRSAIGNISLKDMEPGEVEEIKQSDINLLVKLKVLNDA